MNIQSKSQRRRINWKQISIIAVMIGVAAFKYYDSQKNTNNQNGGQRGGTAQLDFPDQIDLDGDLAKSGQSGKTDLKFKPIQGTKTSDSQKSTSGNSNSNKPYLSEGQRGKMLSPAGLIYNSGRNEHRTEHVLRHAKDMPNRPVHSVFDAKGDEVFRLIDEAYEMIQSNSRQVSKDKSDPNKKYRTAYTIDMKRRIGYRGGERGKREGNPKLFKIKLIIDNGNQVTTAYPF